MTVEEDMKLLNRLLGKSVGMVATMLVRRKRRLPWLANIKGNLRQALEIVERLEG